VTWCGSSCLIASLVFPFSSCLTVNATSVAIVLSKNSVVIVTDSEVTEAGKPVGSACKIIKVGDLYFVPVLLGEDWTVAAILSSLEWMGTIDQRIAHNIATLAPLLQKEANSNTAIVNLAKRHDGLVLELNVAGYENGAARLNLIKYHLSKENGTYHIQSENRPIAESDASVGPSVNRPIFDKFMAESHSSLSAAEKFVQREIDHKAPTVGPPLQALVLDSTGKATWVHRPKFCGE
jgi:hypothetical protein